MKKYDSLFSVLSVLTEVFFLGGIILSLWGRFGMEKEGVTAVAVALAFLMLLSYLYRDGGRGNRVENTVLAVSASLAFITGIALTLLSSRTGEGLILSAMGIFPLVMLLPLTVNERN